MKNIKDIRADLALKHSQEDFVIDKNGGKVVELLGVSFIADETAIFGKVNEKYVEKELEWYLSESLNVYDMPKTPLIWKQIADKDGNINSNYGWAIFNKSNGDQCNNVIRTLRKDKDTRRATMIYTRPTMHTDYNIHGKSDFMCTNAVNYFIRDDKLYAVVQMRSNDVVFGFKNDYAWQKWVLESLKNNLLEDYPDLETGDIIWNAASLHVYERHFDILQKYTETGEYA